MKHLKTKTYGYAILALAMTFSACNEKEECPMVPCGGNGASPMVDLIILIDGSGSMFGSASDISNQADSAVIAALNVCPVDLRVTYLSLHAPWTGTKFTDTHENYLVALHGSGVSLARHRTPSGYVPELGANAIEDLSSLFDWRTGACRAIFYISDEELHGSSPRGDFAIETAETQLAIDAANNNSVTVSANYLTYQGLGASILTNYQDLTTQTGGQLFDVPGNPLPASYYLTEKVFDSLVCNACNNCDISITH